MWNAKKAFKKDFQNFFFKIFRRFKWVLEVTGWRTNGWIWNWIIQKKFFFKSSLVDSLFQIGDFDVNLKREHQICCRMWQFQNYLVFRDSGELHILQVHVVLVDDESHPDACCETGQRKHNADRRNDLDFWNIIGFSNFEECSYLHGFPQARSPLSWKHSD